MLKSNLLIYSIDLNSIFYFKESVIGVGLILTRMENSNSESNSISSIESVSIVINPENIAHDELLGPDHVQMTKVNCRLKVNCRGG